MTDEPALGLHFGQRLKFTTHGALSQAAVSSATIREALDLVIKYLRIRFGAMAMRVFTEGADAVIELRDHVGIGDLMPFLIEAMFVSLMEVNLLLFGTKLLQEGSCRLSYPEPSYRAEYHRFFYDAVSFDTGVNQLRFRREFLDQPMTLANPVAKRRAEQACRRTAGPRWGIRWWSGSAS